MPVVRWPGKGSGAIAFSLNFWLHLFFLREKVENNLVKDSPASKTAYKPSLRSLLRRNDSKKRYSHRQVVD